MSSQIEDDDDNPEWMKADFARATLIEDLPAEHRDVLLAAFPKTAARIGRPPKEDRKVPVSLRLDPDVVDHYRATGPRWQVRINQLLRESMTTSQR